MHRKTTFWGVLAAAAQSVLAVAVLPPPFNLIVQGVAALATALLGHSAADASAVKKLSKP